MRSGWELPSWGRSTRRSRRVSRTTSRLARDAATLLVVTSGALVLATLLTWRTMLISGYANRPEVDQFKAQKDIDKLNVDYFRNQTKPQIDLVSSYSITGAGGTPTTSLTCPAGTALGSNFLCNPGGLPPTVTTANVNSTFIGGYGTALRNLLSNKYNTITFGLNISFPFRITKRQKPILAKPLQPKARRISKNDSSCRPSRSMSGMPINQFCWQNRASMPRGWLGSIPKYSSTANRKNLPRGCRRPFWF